MLKPLLVTCTLFTLTACGGGSAGNDSNTQSSAGISPSSSSLASSVASSTSVSNSSTSSTATGIPQAVAATPGNTSITLDWDTVANATAYHLYYASEANIQPLNINSFDGGTWIQNVTPPYVINGLQNATTYYLVVTAVVAGVESAASKEVSATPMAVDLAKQPTAQEVLILELINRARANPTAEATSYGIDLNEGITEGLISADPKPPLAHNLFLIDAARKHSQWMLDLDIFDHTGVDGSAPWDRMADAGYVFSGNWTAAENISWGGTTGSSINLTDYAFSHHEGLFKSPGHRKNILGSGYREIGIGQKQGNFTTNGKTYLASMLTQAFARSGSALFLGGVVYQDTNNNNFYDVGEGLSGITVSVNGKGYSVFSTGAYSIPLSKGTYDLAITGDALGSPVYRTLEINNANVKLNVVKHGNAIEVLTW